MPDSSPEATFQVRRQAGEVVVRFAGCWKLEACARLGALKEELNRQARGAERLTFDLSDIGPWDTTLPMAVSRTADWAGKLGLRSDLSTLPRGVGRLVALARAVPENKAIAVARPSWVARVGLRTIGLGKSGMEFVRFLGDCALSFGRLLIGRAAYRGREFYLLLESCGFQALPIVALISFLVGLILAFVAAVQLRWFGADIYVADLVGLAVVREMGALMTAIIMAGRSGAAFAAHIGTMKVSEEIDALTTFGFHPSDILVLPRLLALFLMMPLLTIYSDFIAIMGGVAVACPMLDISFAQYMEETRSILTFGHVAVGVAKSTVFGLLVALAGCFHGLRCGRNAAAVGAATTKAVVLGITLVVCADGVFAIICEAMDW